LSIPSEERGITMDSYTEAAIKVYDAEQVCEAINFYNKEICNYNNCENIVTEEVQVPAGDQFLTLSFCKNHVGEFENDIH
jgi:hypothetical protein